jgi:hypothetical protein
MKSIKKIIRKKVGFYTSRYQQLMDIFELRKPENMVEVGVWTAERSVQFLKTKCLKSYHGFDLFEDITTEIQDYESMGDCHLVYKDDIEKKLNQLNTKTEVSLHKGNTLKTLPEFVSSTQKKFDFILIDGGHSVETITNDWNSCEQLLADEGVCIFDDYYLNTKEVGCKEIIDSLDQNKWEIEFFNIIAKNVENNYNTMVAVNRTTN